jgi:DNA-binding transcriptional regulator PaaX
VTNDEREGEQRWFVLVYKLPSEPSRYRASVWRKLKAAGAVYLQNGVAALPNDPGG